MSYDVYIYVCIYLMTMVDVVMFDNPDEVAKNRYSYSCTPTELALPLSGSISDSMFACCTHSRDIPTKVERPLSIPSLMIWDQNNYQ
jgi:hypothetical protein